MIAAIDPEKNAIFGRWKKIGDELSQAAAFALQVQPFDEFKGEIAAIFPPSPSRNDQPLPPLAPHGEAEIVVQARALRRGLDTESAHTADLRRLPSSPSPTSRSGPSAVYSGRPSVMTR